VCVGDHRVEERSLCAHDDDDDEEIKEVKPDVVWHMFAICSDVYGICLPSAVITCGICLPSDEVKTGICLPLVGLLFGMCLPSVNKCCHVGSVYSVILLLVDWAMFANITLCETIEANKTNEFCWIAKLAVYIAMYPMLPGGNRIEGG
jgi:hypothetical protein